MNKRKAFLIVFLIAAVIYLIAIKPSKAKTEYQPYFVQLNTALKSYQPGASAGLIDLDNLDSNIQFVQNKLGSGFKLRLVTKSLPSIDLLKYLTVKCNTNRLMVFSEPFIADLLDSLNADSLDLLLGKPLPAAAVSRLSGHKGWSTISWLVDTKARLNEYLLLAKKENIRIKISAEIDVGLHRGGFETPKQLEEAVNTIKQNNQYLQLTGLMGYDGHVPYVPFYINKEKSIKKAFVDVQNQYTAFVEVLRKEFGSKFVDSCTLNGGGSRTYFYYPEFKSVAPINDIAMGSGFLGPAQFPELLKMGHKPVLYLCSPISKKIETAKLPHAEKISPLVNLWNPNLKVSYFMLGGGWPGEHVSPLGLQKNPFWDENSLGYSNLLPNQSILSGSDENNLNVGDFAFSHAWEGDGMLTFKKLVLVREGKVVGEWQTYKGGN